MNDIITLFLFITVACDVLGEAVILDNCPGIKIINKLCIPYM